MKANIFDVKRFAVHDGPGIRTTLFLKGCPLRCNWCHNPESQAESPVTLEIERKLNGGSVCRNLTYGENASVEELLDRLARDRIFFEESGGGVTFSGGEPLMQIDALEALLRGCKERGLHTTVDTCGYAPREHFEKILDLTDLFLYDLKIMDPEKHSRHTGVGNERILNNADFLLENGAGIIFRIPVLPGINTSEEELGAFNSFLRERIDMLSEVHLLPYHRIAEHKYKRLNMPLPPENLEEPSPEFLEVLKTKFETTGLKVKIGG